MDMAQDRYVPLTGNWYLGTDGMSFMLIRKRVIADAARAKKENIGKAQYETVGYYPTLSAVAAGLHRYLSMEVLDNNNFQTLTEYVNELKKRIESVEQLDGALIGLLKSRMGVSDERDD